jgi:xanthine dehydrogenase YagS FAD-binding subunit
MRSLHGHRRRPRINSCLSLAVMHDGDKVTTIEGLGTPDKLHPMQAAFVKHDGYQCGYCTPGQICSAVAMLDEIKAGVPSHVTLDITRTPNHEAELRERMSGNICRCGAYSNIVEAIGEVAGGGGNGMKAFTYERARTPAEAAAAAPTTRAPRFIAGGTNLLDLMKLEIETPRHLIDVNGLALDKIEPTPTAACASAPWCAIPTSPRRRAVRATTACCRAPCSPAPRASCATRPRPPATCCSGRAARTSTTPTALQQARARKRLRRSAASPAGMRSLGTSEACIATHPSDMAVAMRVLDATVETVRPGRRDPHHPDRRLPPPAGQHAAHRNDPAPGELITAVTLPRPVGGAHIYRKVRDRASYAFASSRSAPSCTADGSGRVALGGVAHKPWRVEAADSAMPRGANRVRRSCWPAPRPPKKTPSS